MIFLLLENALLLFIDIAGLKEINDIYGMQLGDEAVIRTARSIQTAEYDFRTTGRVLSDRW